MPDWKLYSEIKQLVESNFDLKCDKRYEDFIRELAALLGL